ncbi:MAG: S8 family serine peptidase [Halanaerobacter sp.]
MHLNKRRLLLMTILCTLLLLSGCTNSTQDVVDDVTDGGRLPIEDSQLPAHAPRQLIVKVTDEAGFEEKLAELEAEVIDEMEEYGIKKVVLGTGVSVTDAIKELEELSGVEYAEPNYEREIMGSFSGTPDDKRYDELWGLEAMNLHEAWQITNGSEDVVIAVIDTGIQSDHPDLAGKVLTGYNVVQENNDTSPVGEHGTHVAGIAGGRGNDGLGIAGVAWESPILPIRMQEENAEINYNFEIAEALTWIMEWAAAHPEKRVVINLSFGGSGRSTFEKEAIDRCIDEGLILVVSMGNETADLVNYPAAYSGVIAVGSTDINNHKSDFSTEGDHISVSAPGSRILSAVPGSDWAYLDGTSMSTPYVTGVIALMLAHRPSLSPVEVKSILEDTAQDLGPEGFDREFGHGLIDAAAALQGEAKESAQLKVKLILDENMGLNSNDYLSQAVVTLKDQAGDYVSNEISDSNGTAVFHDLDSGVYDIEVNYSKSGQELIYLQSSLEELAVQAGEDNEEQISLTAGYVDLSDIVVESVPIDGSVQDLTSLSKFDILDAEGDLVFKDIGDPNIILKPGAYMLRAYNFSNQAYFAKEISIELGKDEEIQGVGINEVPLGGVEFALRFQDEAGNAISEPQVNFRIYNQQGQLVVADKMTFPASGELINHFAPGDYSVEVDVSKEGSGGPDLVTYQELEMTVKSGEITTIDETWTLR